MRRIAAFLAISCAFLIVSCKPKVSGPGEGKLTSLAATVHMADPNTAGQLLSGFHQIENGAWRWTERKFVVALRPPARSKEMGAVLDLKLTIPEVTTEKLGAVTLTASIAGTALAPETFSKPGEYAYRRDVAPALLAGDSVRVEFELDKAIPPGDTDLRELGLVAVQAGFQSK